MKFLCANQLKFLCEACYNIQNKNLEISESSKKILGRYKNQLIKLSNPKLSLKKAKKIVVKGGFFGSLLAVLASTIAPIVIKSVLKLEDDEQEVKSQD